MKYLAPIYNNCIRYLSDLLPSTPALSACADSGVYQFLYKTCKRTISNLERTENQGPICFLEEQANLVLETMARIPATGGWTQFKREATPVSDHIFMEE